MLFLNVLLWESQQHFYLPSIFSPRKNIGRLYLEWKHLLWRKRMMVRMWKMHAISSTSTQSKDHSSIASWELDIIWKHSKIFPNFQIYPHGSQLHPGWGMSERKVTRNRWNDNRKKKNFSPKGWNTHICWLN